MDRKPGKIRCLHKKNPVVTEPVSTLMSLRSPVVSLWQDYQYNNHHWGMAVDLNSCILARWLKVRD
jgi:hypothetical protein